MPLAALLYIFRAVTQKLFSQEAIFGRWRPLRLPRLAACSQYPLRVIPTLQ